MSVLVSGLPGKYNVARSNIYTRLNQLGIEPTKDERKRSVITDEQVAVLDALDKFLSAVPGATVNQFKRQYLEANEASFTVEPDLSRQDIQDAQAGQDSSLAALDPKSALVAMVAAIAEELQPPSDPLAGMRGLSEAAREGWLLPSDIVRRLVGRETIPDRYGSFKLNRADGSQGRQLLWRVERID